MRIRQAKQGVEIARQDERRTDLDVTYDVRRLYYAGVRARQLVQITKDTLARMEATLELTEQPYKTGTGTVKKTDYLRNKSTVETIRSVLAEMESKEQVVQAALVAVMGMDWSGRVEIADREIAFAPFDCDVQALVNTAYRSNPDVARVEAAVKAAELGIKAARSGHLPKIALLGSAVGIANSYDAGIVTPENKRTWMMGIGIDIPIFEGFRVTNEEREARANLQKLQHQLALLRQGLALQIQTTCSELLKARNQQKSSREALQSATENRELNVRAYQEELVETKDVIEARLMEALLSGQHQKVLYDHMEALAKLDLVVGTDVTPLPSGRK